MSNISHQPQFRGNFAHGLNDVAHVFPEFDAEFSGGVLNVSAVGPGGKELVLPLLFHGRDFQVIQ